MRVIVSEHGQMPTVVGLATSGNNINLLDMPGSGFDNEDILSTRKIASMRFIDDNTIRVAVAEAQEFGSSSLLVFDVDTDNNRVFVLGTYHAGPEKDLLSVLVTSAGNVFVCGRDQGRPFLAEWMNQFQPPVFYSSTVPPCGTRSSFDFGRPIPDGEPKSYTLLQESVGQLCAIVGGIWGTGKISTYPSDLPLLGLARFDLSLNLIGINPLPEEVRYSYDSITAGLVGYDNNFLIQYSRFPHVECNQPRRATRPTAQELSGTLNRVSEVAYGAKFGYVSTQRARHAASAVRVQSMWFFLAEDTGIYQEDGEVLSDLPSICGVAKDESLFVLQSTTQGLRLVVFDV